MLKKGESKTIELISPKTRFILKNENGKVFCRLVLAHACDTPDIVYLFPGTQFKPFPLQDQKVEIEKQADVLHFQFAFCHRNLVEELGEELKAHLCEVFSDFDRCLQMVEVLKWYSSMRKLKSWKNGFMHVMMPLIVHFTKNFKPFFFEGSDLDFGKAIAGQKEFKISIGPWFPKKDGKITFDEPRVKHDLIKFWDFFMVTGMKYAA